jgi:pimeloyl-ACP methyl ester carboxylesterase
MRSDSRPADGWRGVNWQRQARTVELGADRISYVELGEGETPVLLVHGLGGNWTAWLESLPALAAKHRVIAVDLPGFGGSPPSGDGISIPGYSRTLERFCECLELAPAVVIGNSLGGWVAADLTLRAPERVRALVLVDAAGIVPTRWERRKALSVMDGAALMAPHAPRFRRTVASRRRLRAMAFRYTAARPGDLAADLVYMAMPAAPDPGFKQALLAARRSWSDGWCDTLTEIECPTLIVWGDRDSLLPLRHGREYARRILNSRLVVVPDAGHLPMLERPAAFNSLVLEFLADSDDVPEIRSKPQPSTANLG